MKKTIAVATALLLSSSLFVGCGPDNNAGPNKGAGTNRAGTMTADNARTPGFNVLNMRSDRVLEKQVNTVLGTRNARVFVANNAAYVYMGEYTNTRELSGTTDNRTTRGTAGVAGTGTGYVPDVSGNRLGAVRSGVGDRTVTDGTGTGLFGNRADNNRGGLFGLGNNDNNRGGLFGTRGNTTDRNGMFNVGNDNVYGTSRSSTLDNGWPFNHGGSSTYTTPTGDATGGAVTGNTTNNFAGRYSAGDFTGYGAAGAGRGAATGRTAGYGYGVGNNTQRGMVMGTTLSDVQQTKVTQAIRKANPSIQNVYFVQQAR